MPSVGKFYGALERLELQVSRSVRRSLAESVQRLPVPCKNVTMITLFARGLCSNLSSDNVPRVNIGSLYEYLRIVQGTLGF